MNKIKKIFNKLILINLSIVIVNKLINISSNVNNIFNSKKLDIFKSSLGDITYKVIGKGKSVILIHNSIPGNSIYEWQYIENNFKNRKVFVINLLGCGDSEKILTTYTNYIYVILIKEFIEKIVKEKTDLVTSNISCNIGLGSMLNNPLLIDKLIMINPEFKISSTKPFYSNLIQYPIIGSFIYNIIYSKKSIDHKLFFLDNDYKTQRYTKTFYDSTHYKNTNSRFLYKSILENNLYLNSSYAIKRINKDIYIISSLSNESNLIKKVKKRKNIKYFKINNSSIYPHIDNPDQVSKKIINILK